MKTTTYKIYANARRHQPCVVDSVFVDANQRFASAIDLKMTEIIDTFSIGGRVFEIGRTQAGDFGLIVYGTGLGPRDDWGRASRIFETELAAREYLAATKTRYENDPRWNGRE